MFQRIAGAALLAAAVFGPCLAPAGANPVVYTRQAVVKGFLGAEKAVGVGPTHRARKEAREESARRQDSYKLWFYRKYGYYPTPQQIHDWYVRSYGVQP